MPLGENMNAQAKPKDCLTTVELAKLLGIGKRRVHRLLESRDIPCIWQGRIYVHKKYLAGLQIRIPGRHRKS